MPVLKQLFRCLGLVLGAGILGHGTVLAQATAPVIITRNQPGTPYTDITVKAGANACASLLKAPIHVRLDNGVDHSSGKVAFETHLEITLNLSTTNGSVAPTTLVRTLSIGQAQPEAVAIVDLPAAFVAATGNIHIQVSINTPLIIGTDPGSQRIVVSCEPVYNISFADGQAAPISLTAYTPPTAGTVAFEHELHWIPTCALVQNYQLQILHRPVSTDPSPTATYKPTAIPSPSDWEQNGLLIETGSATAAYKLTLAEGEGTYHWRVRALGNQPNGVANPANWGQWSSSSFFSVEAPNKDLNWIYSRTFTEGGRVAEKLTFANGLQQVHQVQTRLASPNQASTALGQQLIATQILQDYSGRDALTSLPFPVTNATTGAVVGVLGYQPKLLSQGTQAYGPEHFDWNIPLSSTTNPVREPWAATELGTANGYYSSQPIANNDRVPDAEGYPFTRTLFSNDGTNRVREQGGVGAALRLKQPTSTAAPRTVRTAYASVTPYELLRLFGRESPEVEGTYKIITTDPNNTSTITYQTKEGQTIATALSKSGGNDTTAALLRALPSAATAGFDVKDFITGRDAVIGKTLTLTQPTTVELNYSITPAMLQDACVEYCSTCDYEVRIRVFELDSLAIPQEFVHLVVASDQCGSETRFLENKHNLPLEAGTYRIEREIRPFTSATADDNNSGIGGGEIGEYLDNVNGFPPRTLSSHLNRIRTLITSATLGEPWTKINQFLDAANVRGLYRYLAEQGFTLVEDVEEPYYEIPFLNSNECMPSVRIPYLVNFCNNECDVTTFDFEAALSAKVAELNGKHPDERQYAIGDPELLPGYNAGDFNAMLVNMSQAGYSCQDLQKCFQSQLNSLEVNLYLTTDVPTGYSFNLLDSYLQCTGVKMSVPVAKPATIDPQQAFRQFAYETRTTTSQYEKESQLHLRCFQALYQTNHPGISGFNVSLQTVLSVFSTYPEKERNKVYDCIKNTAVVDTPPASASCTVAAEQRDEMVRSCSTICEDRRGEFLTAIVNRLHLQGIYVQGDEFEGQIIAGFYTLTNTVLSPEQKREQVQQCELDMLVQEMVDECQHGCQLTLVPDQDNSYCSVGTLAEHDAMKKSMLHGFRLAVVDTNRDPDVCETGLRRLTKREEPIKPSLTIGAKTVVQYLGALARGVNKAVLLPNHPIGCPNPGGIGETSTNVFSYVGPLSAAHLTRNSSTCADESGLTSIALIDDRTFQIYGNGYKEHHRKFFRQDFDYALVWDKYGRFCNSLGVRPVDLPLSVAPPCIQPVDLDVDDNYHFDMRFVQVVNGQATNTAIEKSTIVDISAPFLADQALLSPITSDESYSSEHVRVRLLVHDTRTNTNSWIIAEIQSDVYKGSSEPTETYPAKRFLQWKTLVPECENKRFQLCFEWNPELDSVELPIDSTRVFDNTTNCNKVAAARIRTAFYEQLNTWGENQLTAFSQQYADQCVAMNGLSESFFLSYPLGYHHFTLYYYDRGGNLIKTVPPAGVQPLSEGTMTSLLTNLENGGYSWLRNNGPAPAHTLRTTYFYNSLHQLTSQASPDGGTTEFHYNQKGQLRFSQNAVQRSIGTYSYTRYDALGRVVEVGESSEGVTSFIGEARTYYERATNKGPVETARSSKSGRTKDVNRPREPTGGEIFVLHDALAKIDMLDFPLDDCKQITRTVYSVPAPVNYLNHTSPAEPQRYLTNRVSYSYLDVDGDPSTRTDNSYTYYSYDPHGNVEWLAQEQTGLPIKFVRYEYDLISNKVLRVKYQEGQKDQFHHRYSYDADNRLTEVYTSTDGVLWDQDARYSYYAHGPLKRLELGEDHVQGIDYTYTLQGWLKGVNHPTVDPGQDGTQTSMTASAADGFGMTLGYFPNDFKSNSALWNANTSALLEPTQGLFNGNISTWTSHNRTDVEGSVVVNNPDQPATSGEAPVAEKYRYDELNRIMNSRFLRLTPSGYAATADYGTNYAYDPNGNLQGLSRSGRASQSLALDQLAYRYKVGTNQLQRVEDGVAAANGYDEDFKPDGLSSTQPAQYTYDAIGNLTKDATSQVTKIAWTIYGKIDYVERNGGLPNGGSKVSYRYDATGNRIAKVLQATATASTTTYYTRDAQGNVLAVYEQAANNGTPGALALREQSIYGSSRLGQYTPDAARVALSDGIYTRTVGQKKYELTDHLGNVRAVVSDIKLPLRNPEGILLGFQPDLRGYYNYYPFGMMQPGRNAPGNATLSGGYRYGYNGQEKSDEISSGNYTAEYWEFDSKIARRWNLDPISKPWHSNYSVMSGSPIWKIDPDGADDIFTSSGKFRKHVDNGTNYIMIEQRGNKLARIDKFDGSSKWFSSVDDYNRAMLSKVVGYYYNKVGGQGKHGVDYSDRIPEAMAAYDPKDNGIWIMLRNGYISSSLVNSYDLQSALEHEIFHKYDAECAKQDGVDFIPSFSSHANVYSKMMATNTFTKTSDNYKVGIASLFAGFVQEAKDQKEDGWQNLVTQFNSTNSMGYSMKIQDSGGLEIYKKDGKQMTLSLQDKKYDPN
ncbi:hypothetical protein [Hymenobacter lucidus]|nr:hypothetical protein [Hymenobacter lucidus]